MPLYECVFIARQDVPSSQVETLTTQFGEVITEMGGTVAKSEYWGLRTLAYRIKKNRKGHYALLNLDAPHEAVTEMERRMRLNEDVLRHLVVRVEELEEGPSAMMQNRTSRDGDRRRGGRDRDGRDRDRGDRGDRGDRDRGDRGDRDRGERGDRPPRGERAETARAPAGTPAEGDA
ncbi:MAG: 30S ribosomal protein S6 [Azospirillaceae bacterium]